MHYTSKNCNGEQTGFSLRVYRRFFCITVGIGCLFIPSWIAVAFFAVAVLCVVYMVHSHRVAKEQKSGQPVVFSAETSFSFAEVLGIFERLTDAEQRLSTCENVYFFRFKKIFKLRVVLYRTNDFSVKEFDQAKDRINKKANKQLQISPWIRGYPARWMRFNVICADALNDALYQFLSQNADHNLRRAEGIIHIAVVGNQIIIPPLYGECDGPAIRRYKGVIRFINQVLLSA